MLTVSRPVDREGGGGGGGLLKSPFWPPKDFIYTPLSVHFLCPTVGKWSTSSLAATENYRCPSKPQIRLANVSQGCCLCGSVVIHGT